MAINKLVFPEPHKVFTPVFNKLISSKKRFIINYGGTGSSKSFSAAQKEVLLAIQEPITTLVIRKVGATLRDSVIPSFKRRIGEFDLWSVFTENKSDRVITCTQTGSQFLFRGLDDPEKMKSIEGVKRIMVEEASELEEDDFLELNRRVRGQRDIQITLNFNPIHEQHWIKKRFFDTPQDNVEIIHSTYLDNPYLTKEDREQIEWLKEYNYNQYRIYALGDWGITENGNPWLFSFDADKHIEPDIQLLPQFPVYLSFDFNREPLACVAFQQSSTKGGKYDFVHVIKEFYENVQLKELCDRIKATFPYSVFFVTGDCNGNSKDLGFDGRNDSYYTMIRNYLGVSKACMNLNTHNLEHNDSRNLINTLLYSYPCIKISRKGCPQLINDCMIARVDDTKAKGGHLMKDRGIYKMDLFDAFRYFFQTYFVGYIPKV